MMYKNASIDSVFHSYSHALKGDQNKKPIDNSLGCFYLSFAASYLHNCCLYHNKIGGILKGRHITCVDK